MPRTSSTQNAKQVTTEECPKKSVVVRWQSQVEESQPEPCRGTARKLSNATKSILKKSKSNKMTRKNINLNNGVKMDKSNQSSQKAPERKARVTNHSNQRFSIEAPQAIIVDTRTLQTFEGDASGSVFIDTMIKFFQMCAHRGALPKYLATPHVSTKVGEHHKQTSIEARACSLDNLISEGNLNMRYDTWKNILVPVQVKMNDSTNVPKSLSAGESWRLFGDLVDIIIDTAQAPSHLPARKSADPIEVVILTSDVSLYTDLRKENHLNASKVFFECIKNYFGARTIDSIQIYILDNGTREVIPIGIEDADKNSVQLMISDLSCSLQNSFSAKNVSLGLGTLDVKVIESSLVILSKLLRQWLRKFIGGSHVEFDLPETMDGSVCSIALDLEYKLLPHSLLSPEVKQMKDDAKLLATMNKFEVVKTIPVQSIDASLIFGIPMIAKAGCECDEIRYFEMRKVVRQLWRWLSVNDVAILLRGKMLIDNTGYFFHHYFLLITDSPVENVGCEGICPKTINGVFFRYAIGEQLLCDNTIEVKAEVEGIDESDEQYFEYIEKSMEYIEHHEQGVVLNPFSLELIGHCMSEVKQNSSNEKNLECSNVKDDSDAIGVMPDHTQQIDRYTDDSGDDFVFDYN